MKKILDKTSMLSNLKKIYKIATAFGNCEKVTQVTEACHNLSDAV